MGGPGMSIARTALQPPTHKNGKCLRVFPRQAQDMPDTHRMKQSAGRVSAGLFEVCVCVSTLVLVHPLTLWLQGGWGLPWLRAAVLVRVHPAMAGGRGSWTTGHAVVAMVLLGRCVVAKPPLMKGICYGPFPAKAPVYAAEIIDDFMTDPAKPLWGPMGRGDLQTIADLGANTVRLYGNNPNMSHTAFLEEAARLELGVIPGISDYPYTQQKGSCKDTGYDCYEQVKASFAGDLRNGWLSQSGSYHRAIKHIIVINEPDLKLGQGEPKKFCKGILSAVDAILDAERGASITGYVPSLTATFSFATCTACTPVKAGGFKPALSQMLDLKTAFMYPETFGYQPRNDLKAAYSARFVNSFNTQNPAAELEDTFFKAYSEEFPGKPVFIGEFHSIMNPLDQMKELNTIISMAQTSKEFIGMNWFEFQKRYDKGGKEVEFGMFELGLYKITSLEYFNVQYDVWCLEPVRDPVTRQRVSQELTQAFGGKGLNYYSLCKPNPLIVPLNAEGFREVKVLGSDSKMSALVERAVQHLGATVSDSAGLAAFAKGRANTFPDLLGLWVAKPSWASWDPDAACVADRASDAYAVGLTIEKACKMSEFNCQDIPWSCKGDPWKTADYVLSTVFSLIGGNPLEKCYFDGSAIFDTAANYKTWDPVCVVTRDPSSTPLSDQGFQAIANQRDAGKMEVFLRRVIETELGARVLDRSQLEAFAAKPAASMFEVRRLLKEAQWLCGGRAQERCSLWAGSAQLWWWRYAMLALAALVAGAVFATGLCVKCHRQCRDICPRKCFDSDSDAEQ